eukprot:gene1776-1290_t
MGFVVATRYRQVAAMINSLNPDKFTLLLTSLIQKLHDKSARLFSDEEEEKLGNMFGVTPKDLKDILECLSYTFEQSAFTSTSPEDLHTVLISGGFDEAHARAVSATWSAEASAYVTRLKDQKLGYQALKSVDYQLNMVMHESDLSRQQDPVGIFELKIGDPANSRTGTRSNENVNGTERAAKPPLPSVPRRTSTKTSMTKTSVSRPTDRVVKKDGGSDVDEEEEQHPADDAETASRVDEAEDVQCATVATDEVDGANRDDDASRSEDEEAASVAHTNDGPTASGQEAEDVDAVAPSGVSVPEGRRPPAANAHDSDSDDDVPALFGGNNAWSSKNLSALATIRKLKDAKAGKSISRSMDPLDDDDDAVPALPPPQTLPPPSQPTDWTIPSVEDIVARAMGAVERATTPHLLSTRPSSRAISTATDSAASAHVWSFDDMLPMLLTALHVQRVVHAAEVDLLQVMGDTVMFNFGPDDLPGLRALQLVHHRPLAAGRSGSSTDTQAREFRVSLEEYHNRIYSEENAEIFDYRSMKRREISLGLILLAITSHRILFGKVAINHKDDFHQAWLAAIQSFDNQASRAAAEGQESAYFALVQVCGNGYAICKKLEVLLESYFAPLFGDHTLPATSLYEAVEAAVDEASAAEAALEYRSGARPVTGQRPLSGRRSAAAAKFRATYLGHSDGDAVTASGTPAATATASATATAAATASANGEPDRLTAQRQRLADLAQSLTAGDVFDANTSVASTLPTSVASASASVSAAASRTTQRPQITFSQLEEELAAADAALAYYPQFAMIFPMAYSQSQQARDDMGYARVILESMNVQAKVYEEWVEVMRDYSTVFCHHGLSAGDADSDAASDAGADGGSVVKQRVGGGGARRPRRPRSVDNGGDHDADDGDGGSDGDGGGAATADEERRRSAAVYKGGNRALHYRVKSSRSEVFNIVCDVFQQMLPQWENLPAGLGLGLSWNLLWTWSKPRINHSHLLIWQKVNHFEESRQLTRKDFLKKNLQRYTDMPHSLAKEFEIMPLTFLLPHEYNAFASVIQKYVENPLCLQQYKFDLRIYVVVTSFKPLEAFIYREGFARVSLEAYSTQPQDMDNLFIHLTNSSIQKKHISGPSKDNPVQTGHDSGADAEVGGSKISLLGQHGLWKRLELYSQGRIQSEDVWQAICTLIVKSLVVVDDKIPHQPNCFELFGYDVLIDSNLRPWLIEVNASPSLARENALDHRVKNALIRDIIELLDVAPFDRAALARVMRRRLNNIAKQRHVHGRNDAELEQDLQDILGDYRPRRHGEMPATMGQFERLAPDTPHFEKVLKLKKKLFKDA